MTNAIAGYGAKFQGVIDSTLHAGIYENIPGVTSISGPEISSDTIEATNIYSTAKEYGKALPDAATVNIEMHWFNDAWHQELMQRYETGQSAWYRILWSDDTGIDFEALIESISLSTEPNGFISCSITFKTSDIIFADSYEWGLRIQSDNQVGAQMGGGWVVDPFVAFTLKTSTEDITHEFDLYQDSRIVPGTPAAQYLGGWAAANPFVYLQIAETGYMYLVDFNVFATTNTGLRITPNRLHNVVFKTDGPNSQATITLDGESVVVPYTTTDSATGSKLKSNGIAFGQQFEGTIVNWKLYHNDILTNSWDMRGDNTGTSPNSGNTTCSALVGGVDCTLYEEPVNGPTPYSPALPFASFWWRRPVTAAS